MDSLTTWEYNGKQFFLDLQDVETLERYEGAFEKFREAEKRIPKDGKNSQILRAYIEVMDDLFDALLGDGAHTALFGDTVNAGNRTDAYDNFLAFVTKQTSTASERRAAIVSKYSANRAQRRAK